MGGVIKLEGRDAPHAQVFNWEDMVHKADAYLEGVRRQAAAILAEARQQAEQIAAEAQQAGRQAARHEAAEQLQGKLADHVASLLPALRQAVRDIQYSRQSWLRHWESATVRLSVAIAERIARRELERRPEIALDWVREALCLAMGSGRIKLYLHPRDHESLGERIQQLVAELGELGETEVIADAQVSAGGCRVVTQFGEVDQRLEAQLARIEEELND